MKRKNIILILITVVFCFCGCDKNEAIFTTGVWNEKTYVNEFANLELTIPTDWVICSKQEIDANVNNVQEAINVDAMAKNETTGDSIVIMYEELGQIDCLNIDEGDYLEILKKEFVNSYSNDTDVYVRPNYELAIHRVESGANYSVLIGDQKYFATDTTFSNLDMQQTFFVRKVDNYMVVILYTTDTNELNINNILAFDK